MRNERGITMMEMMVVLMLSGIILRFMLPSFAHYRLTLVETQTKNMLYEDLRAARQRAITKHVPVIVAFGNGSTTTNLTTYTIHADTNGDRVWQAGEVRFAKTLARDSKLTRVSLTPTDSIMFDVSGALKTGTSGGKLMVKTGKIADTLQVSIAGIIYKP